MAERAAAGGKHVVVIGAYPESLVNFRGELIRTLVRAGHRVTAMAAPATRDVIARIEALGAEYRDYPVARAAMNPVDDLRTFLALRRALTELRPDVVMAYTIKPVVWGGIAARAVPGVRFFALITGLGYALDGTGLRRGTLTALVSRLFRAALARAAGAIFQNEENREVFIARGLIERARTHRVFGSGVDCSAFKTQPLPPVAPTFLVIARLLRAKGLREFAAAARIVKRTHPEAIFRIVGGADPSPDRIDVSEVEGWAREGVVEYGGAASDVRPALAGCHIYVLPSYHEGMPRTVLEAMATGRPILTTDTPGCRDTVVPGENGFLVPKGDAEALAERMLWFLANRGEWERMAAASRALAESRFEVGRINTDMVRIMGLGAP